MDIAINKVFMASIGLINRVKYSKTLYRVYFYIGSWLVNLLKLFLMTDDKLIVFNSFGGRKYDDSPKCIYEAMIKDPRFDDYQFVWAFINPDSFVIPRGKIIKCDTFTYFKTLLKARVWVTNSTMERGLRFKGSRTFYFNSWHGTPIKLMGRDIDKSNASFRSKGAKCPYDVFCAQSQFDADVFKKSFHVPEQAMKVIGLPRNDELVNNAGEERKNIVRELLGIPNDKKVILYAPTYREYAKDEYKNCVMAPPINLDKWKDSLGKEYVLLFRAHYEVVKVLNVTSNDFVKDVSAYPSLNDLMIVSDMLISDYSSIFFDYSIMGKPMLCFAYDYDEYQSRRGMYFDVREELDCIAMDAEEKVLEEILSLDIDKRNGVTVKFRNKYVTSFGFATKRSLDLIYETLEEV